MLDAEALAERVLTDGELECADLTVEVAALLRDAGPWGQGFPEPCFDGRFDLLSHKVLKDVHVKMSLRPSGGREAVEAIAFNRAGAEWLGSGQLRLVYRLDVNDYFATPRVQLIVEHVEGD
jgi:single-stranded-DNA-specific exonuclease